MAPLETVLIWVSLGLYAVVSALYIYSFVFKNQILLGRLTFLVGVAFLCQTAGILARYQAVGNLPIAGTYETGLAGSWFVVAFTLFVSVRHRTLKAVGVATLPFSLLMLGVGVMSNPPLTPMAASVRSFWLYIHVLFAWFSYGSYAMAFGLAVVFLLQEKNPEREFYRKFPDPERMQDLMLKYVVVGFVTDAIMIASGAIWAKNLWGNYWSWDPVETWSLVTWIIYGLAIHLRLTMGWRGKRFAWILVVALLGVVISFFGITLVVRTSLHFFEAWRDL